MLLRFASTQYAVGYELAVVNGGGDYQGGGVLEHPMTLPFASCGLKLLLLMLHHMEREDNAQDALRVFCSVLPSIL